MNTNVISFSKHVLVRLFCFSHVNANQDVDKPILLWLEGGPGAASTFTAFVENGPYELVNRTWVRKRQFAWTNEFHMLFIDSPVGTGYSFGDSDDCYSRDEQSVASNLYEALKQFFTMFAEYKNNPFFLTGESYAGKYVPALGYHIHQNLDESRDYFNFTGIGIGMRHSFDHESIEKTVITT